VPSLACREASRRAQRLSCVCPPRAVFKPHARRDAAAGPAAQLWRVYQRGMERWLADLLQPVFDNLVADKMVPRFVQRLRILEFTIDHEAPYFSNMRRRTSRKARRPAPACLPLPTLTLNLMRRPTCPTCAAAPAARRAAPPLHACRSLP
jgi:hypothetical protein